MDYMSMEMQDQFAHIMIGNKGTFLDLGSAHPIIGNNTVFLESIGWTGVAFDSIEPLADAMNKSGRRTPCFCIDVSVEHPFIDILNKYFPDKHIDYISLDVDDASVPCLELILKNGFTFGVMTFEHDAYLDGEKRREPARKLLEDAGYKLQFGNVQTCDKNHSSGGPRCRPKCDHTDGEVLEWEDWWVSPKHFLSTCATTSKSHQECIQILKEVHG